MITRLNLSSQPFRNRTLPYVLAGLMVFLACAGGIYNVSRYRSVTKENLAGKQSIEELRTEIAALKEKGEKVQKSLQPEQKALMVAGHRLVATKEFGWSRLLYDIERVLPNDVSASRVSVENVFKDGDSVAAELEFAVVSRNYTSVLNMIQRMNQSGIFRASLRGQDLQEADRVKYTEYTMFLVYRPAAGFSANPPADIASVGTEGGNPSNAR